MKSLGPAWIIAVAIIGSLLATHREASGSSKWNLELVADSSTPIAGLNRFQAPATSGGNIAFLARDANGAKVIYTLIGDSINRLADTNPSATDVTTWIDLEDPSISENYLAFWGRKGGGGTSASIQMSAGQLSGSFKVTDGGDSPKSILILSCLVRTLPSWQHRIKLRPS